MREEHIQNSFSLSFFAVITLLAVITPAARAQTGPAQSGTVATGTIISVLSPEMGQEVTEFPLSINWAEVPSAAAYKILLVEVGENDIVKIDETKPGNFIIRPKGDFEGDVSTQRKEYTTRSSQPRLLVCDWLRAGAKYLAIVEGLSGRHPHEKTIASGYTIFSTSRTTQAKDRNAGKNCGILTGRVYLGSRPLAGVKVLAYSEQAMSAAAVWKVITNSEGAYTLDGLPAGQAQVNFEPPSSDMKIGKPIGGVTVPLFGESFPLDVHFAYIIRQMNPGDDQVVTNTSPTFCWQPPSGAVKYILNVWKAGAQPQEIYREDGDAAGACVTPQRELPRGERIQWTLRAFDAQGGLAGVGRARFRTAER